MPNVRIAEGAAALMMVDVLRVMVSMGHIALCLTLLFDRLFGLLTGLFVAWRYLGLKATDLAGLRVVSFDCVGNGANVGLIHVHVSVLVLDVGFWKMQNDL